MKYTIEKITHGEDELILKKVSLAGTSIVPASYR